jgi:hypothetical protein
VVTAASLVAALRGNAIWDLGIRAVTLVASWTPRQKEVLVFACAFLVRFSWAANVVRTTGANFMLASDDGQNYLHFGRLLASVDTQNRPLIDTSKPAIS